MASVLGKVAEALSQLAGRIFAAHDPPCVTTPITHRYLEFVVKELFHFRKDRLYENRRRHRQWPASAG